MRAAALVRRQKSGAGMSAQKRQGRQTSVKDVFELSAFFDRSGATLQGQRKRRKASFSVFGKKRQESGGGRPS